MDGTESVDRKALLGSLALRLNLTLTCPTQTGNGRCSLSVHETFRAPGVTPLPPERVRQAVGFAKQLL